MNKSNRGLPSREEIARFLEGQTGKVGKRDVARAFGIKGDDRIELKRLLADMAARGQIDRARGKGIKPAGTLPSVAILQIAGFDPHGLLVAHPAQWPDDAPRPVVEIVEDGRIAGPAPGLDDRVLARIERQQEGEEVHYRGRIIRTLSREADRVLGVLRREESGEYRLVPSDRRAKSDFRVDPQDVGAARDGDLVAAETVPGRSLGLPRARVREALGSLDTPRAISLIAIHGHGIPVAFPPDAIDQAKAAKPVALDGREDLRYLPLVTIDPADARDHDDAIFAQADDDPKNPGGHHIVVAIADVAHYVRPGTPLDRAARLRGNSTYFPDRVVPMLPEELSADLCSLLEGEDRACLAVHMWLDAEGRKLRHRFTRGLLRVAADLHYEAAQDAVDGKANERAGLVEPVLKPLWAAWRALMTAREARHPLEIDAPERVIRLSEEGRVASIEPRRRLDAHRVVEEFMILANVAAAETLEDRRQPCMYRVHDQPTQQKLETLRQFLGTIGIKLPKGQVLKPRQFNGILARTADGPHARAVTEMVLRSQAQAVYSPDNLGHFGLALRRYAHFTSPIRRYADLVVHRALIRGLKLGEGGLSDDEVPGFTETAEHISATERRSMAAERESTDRYLAAYMADRIDARFSARISGVTRFGLFVTLDDTGASGLVPVSSLGSDFFRFDEAAQALVGSRNAKRFALGDTLTVRLREATPITGGLVFTVAARAAEDGDDDETFPARPRGRRPPQASRRSRRKQG